MASRPTPRALLQGFKFPIALLLDTSSGGAAECVASKILEWAKSKGEDVEILLREDVNAMELVRGLFKTLEEKGLYKPPVLYVSRVVDSRDEVMRTAEACGAKVVEDVRQCTHHLVPDVVSELPPSKEEVCAILKDDGVARVHWTFYPSSYDYTKDLADEEAKVLEKYQSRKEGAFLVPVRWLMDSQKHMEWMLEQDYLESSLRKETIADDANAKEEQDAAMERKRRRLEEPVTLTKVAHVQEVPIDTAAAMADAAEGKGPGDNAVDSVVLPAQDEEDEEEMPDVEKEKLRELYIVPGHAGWFDYERIHEIEKRGCPDFFDGRDQTQTPKTYKQFRNYMIDKFREDPRRRITFTDCRKALVGEVSSRLRIFEFLEHWGLINYIPAKKMAAGTAGEILPEDAQTGIRLISSTQAGLPSGKGEELAAFGEKALYRFPAVTAKAALDAAFTGGALPTGTLIGTKGAFGAPSAIEAFVTDEDRLRMVYCNSCGGQCSQLWYKCTTKLDYDLCPFCFSEGKHVEGLSSGDFVRMEAGGKLDNQGWTKQEVLLLLEGLELYNENWQEVAEHVGTKSQLECINYFLTMPIEDQFLNQLEFYHDQGGEEPSLEDDIPFADAGNPVMAQVAFLSSMVGPRVAAAAAQAALNTLATEDPLVSEDARKAIYDALGTTSGEKAPNGVMAVDKNEVGNGEKSDMAVNPSIPASSKPEANEIPMNLKMRAASATALSAAAVKAKLLADQEEKEIQRLMVKVVELQLKKMEAKLKQFEQLEDLVVKERDQIEAQRQKLFADRIQLQAARFSVPRAPTLASGPPDKAPSAPQVGSTTKPDVAQVTATGAAPASAPPVSSMAAPASAPPASSMAAPASAPPASSMAAPASAPPASSMAAPSASLAPPVVPAAAPIAQAPAPVVPAPVVAPSQEPASNTVPDFKTASTAVPETPAAPKPPVESGDDVQVKAAAP